jgi:hypothetical protein
MQAVENSLRSFNEDSSPSRKGKTIDLQSFPFQPSLPELTAIVKLGDGTGIPRPISSKGSLLLLPNSVPFLLTPNTVSIAMRLSPTAFSPSIENSCRCFHWMPLRLNQEERLKKT